MTFEEGRLAIGDFLNINLIDNAFIFLDIWSIVHLVSGALLMLLILNLKNKNKNKTFFGILVSWELFEFINYGLFKNSLFLKESTLDVSWDLITGIGGGFFGIFIKKIREK